MVVESLAIHAVQGLEFLAVKLGLASVSVCLPSAEERSLSSETKATKSLLHIMRCIYAGKSGEDDEE